MSEVFRVLTGTTIALPAIQVVILISALSLCLVFRTARLGLIVAYLFAYRWGFLFFTHNFPKFLLVYLLLGGIVALLTVINMFFNPEV